MFTMKEHVSSRLSVDALDRAEEVPFDFYSAGDGWGVFSNVLL